MSAKDRRRKAYVRKIRQATYDSIVKEDIKRKRTIERNRARREQTAKENNILAEYEERGVE